MLASCALSCMLRDPISICKLGPRFYGFKNAFLQLHQLTQCHKKDMNQLRHGAAAETLNETDCPWGRRKAKQKATHSASFVLRPRKSWHENDTKFRSALAIGKFQGKEWQGDETDKEGKLDTESYFQWISHLLTIRPLLRCLNARG